VIVLESLLGSRLQLGGVPKLDRLVERTTKHCTFVDVVPFAREDFASVAFCHDNGTLVACGCRQVPQLQGAISASTEDLVLIGLIEAYVIGGVWGLELSKHLHSIHIDLHQIITKLELARAEVKEMLFNLRS